MDGVEGGGPSRRPPERVRRGKRLKLRFLGCPVQAADLVEQIVKRLIRALAEEAVAATEARQQRGH